MHDESVAVLEGRAVVAFFFSDYQFNFIGGESLVDTVAERG